MPELFSSIISVLDKFIPDKDKRESLAHELSTMANKHAHEVAMAQLELNKAEAQHRSIFVSGWRPFCGWLCVFALGAHFILFPVIAVIATASGSTITLPQFDMSSLMTVLLGMLGLGTLRTYEKQKGLTK